MSIKSETTANYLDRQREIHGHKKWRQNYLRVVMTGASREGSIGADIANRLSSTGCLQIWSTTFDVRREIILSSMQEYNTLILCHGASHLDWFEDLPHDKAEEIIDVNLFGTVKVIQHFVRDTLMTEERKRIIIIGSMAHRVVLNGSAVYCASKAGVAMLSRCLAWELAPKGFDVFCIHPSNTEGTPMTQETIKGLMRYRGLTRSEASAYWNDSPIRQHILQTDDISGLVQFLLQPGSEWLAGAQLEMAGGQR